jgi:hypothetical protein
MRRRSRAGPERAKSRRRKTVTQKRQGLRNPSAADHKTQSDVAQLIRERDEALEQQTATAEVLYQFPLIRTGAPIGAVQWT